MNTVRWRPGPRSRKVVLVVHIAGAGTWLGIDVGLGSRYGLVRYWWVAVKLVLNVVLVTLVVVLQAPELGRLAASARDALGEGRELPGLTGLAFPPVVSTTAVLFAMTISTFKPWGKVRG